MTDLIEYLMTDEERAEEEAELQKQFEQDNFIPAYVDPDAPVTKIIYKGLLFTMPMLVMPLNLDEVVVPQCVGCDRIKDDYTCNAYIKPEAWFRNGKHCPLASHIKTPTQVIAEKKRVGQQKQKKSR